MSNTKIVLDREYDEDVIHLTYLSMLDPNINSGDTEGLDHAEVEDIIKTSDRDILKLYLDDKVIAIAGPTAVHHELYRRIGLNTHKHYQRLGFIFVHPDHQHKGYGEQILKWFCENNEDVLYLTKEDNLPSHNLANRNMTYLKRWYNLWRSEYWSVFVK